MRSPDSARFCRKTACIGNGDDPRVAALLVRQTCREINGLGPDLRFAKPGPTIGLRFDMDANDAVGKARTALAVKRS